MSEIAKDFSLVVQVRLTSRRKTIEPNPVLILWTDFQLLVYNSRMSYYFYSVEPLQTIL